MAALLQRERRSPKIPPRISNVSLPKKKHNLPLWPVLCRIQRVRKKKNVENLSQGEVTSHPKEAKPREKQKKKGERRESLFAPGDGGGDARDPCERDFKRGGEEAGGRRTEAEAETGRGGTPPTLTVAVAVVHWPWCE